MRQPEGSFDVARPSVTRVKGVWVGLVIALFWLGISWFGGLQRAQWAAYHLLFDLRGPQAPPGAVTIVAVDEASMEALGAWPVSRQIWAELINGLFAARARVVGIDITFVQAAPDGVSDRIFSGALSRYEGRVVLAANFQPMQTAGSQGLQLVLPHPRLRSAAEVGIVDLPFDSDGAIHRFPSLVSGLDVDDVSAQKDYEGFAYAVAVRYASAPIERLNDRLINYSGPPGWLRRVSLISALEAIRAGDSEIVEGFRDKAVLIGATALRLQDQYPTPFSATFTGAGSATYMPGVEIHAHAVATLLNGNHVRTPPAFFGFLANLAWGLGLGLLLFPLSPRPALTAAALSLLLLLSGVMACFFYLNLWIDAVVPSLIVVMTLVSGIAVQYAQAEAQRRITRRTFERYVAREIVEMLLAKPWLAPRMGGESREVTLLFSDVRAFTSLSEQRTPEEVVAFLNAYLTEMARVIRQEMGCIDKYIGDAILAVWGNVIPISSEEAARRAVRAALKMLASLEQRRAEWSQQGFPDLAIGIGINTGDAVVGNIGSPEKMEFGVIGDAVNVASRLEGLTKEHGALLVSARTRELLGDGFNCERIGPIPVKGRVQPVEVWRVLGEVAPVPEHRATW
ncbi:MAG: adenylate/guanylate cyclase domain-containing protein [Candidatus Sericytochromatia bacterium]|nr:adenylate/guanylate cyclase domain-containing protein [Candidatus Sericytochromatia bacterium]